MGEDRAARGDRGERERGDDVLHARGADGPEDVLEQRDLVGGELRGVRPADVAVLVVADQRVDLAGMRGGEVGVGLITSPDASR